MIIAELCGNHNGNKTVFWDMVKSAIDAGSNIIKIQSFFADDLTESWRSKDFDRIKSLELDWDVHKKFVETCRSQNVIPMTSVYTTRYLQNLYDCGFTHIKIGSAQASNVELLTHYIAAGFKVIVSTGGRLHLKELPRLAPLAGVLHCVSKYPHSPYEANLKRMLDIRRYWPNEAIGFSDHSDPLHAAWDFASKSALVLGATYVERHFTILDRSLTKDGPVSVDQKQLENLCRFDRLSFAEKLEAIPMLGTFHSRQCFDEIELIKHYETRWKQ